MSTIDIIESQVKRINRVLTQTLKAAQLTIHDCLFKLFMNQVSTTRVIHLGNVTGSIRRYTRMRRNGKSRNDVLPLFWIILFLRMSENFIPF